VYRVCRDGDIAVVVYRHRAACCGLLFVGERTSGKHVDEDMLPEDGENCLSCTAVYDWMEKLTQGLSKLGDNGRPGHGAEIATDMTEPGGSSDPNLLMCKDWPYSGCCWVFTRCSPQNA